MKKIFTILISAIAVVNGFTQNCIPRDLSFGNGGVSYGITGTQYLDYTGNIVIQPDGKIIQSAAVSIDFCLIRYKPDGGLDSTFGTNGKVITPVGTGQDYIQFVTLQPDGKIVAVGNTYNQSNSDFAILRYNSDGTLDSSFGIGGKVITAVGSHDDYAYRSAIQVDGKIIVAGSSGDSTGIFAYAMVRYNSNGSIDSSFGQNGKIVTHLGHFITYIGNTYYGQYSGEYANNVLIQTDGKIILGGESYSHGGCYDYYGYVYCNPVFAMARYNINGIPDSSFGNNGKVVDSTFLFYPSAMIIQADNKIIVTGGNYDGNVLTERFNSNGAVDSSFGVNGKVTTVFCTQNCQAHSNSLAIQANGKIVLAATFNIYNTAPKFAIVRYDVNGSLDNTFNGNGMAVFHVDSSGSDDYATGVAIQDNKIIAGGYSSVNQLRNVEVVRLLDSGQAITPVITPGGTISFCQGATANLTADQTGVTQWYKNGVAINGANSSTYTVSTSGSYTVEVSNSSGCGLSLPVTVAVNNNPPRPPINWVTPQFSTAVGYAHYEWLLNGVLIAGSDSSIYKPVQTGSYKVSVIDNHACRSTSDSFNLVVLAVADITVGNARLRYYPNPAKIFLNIDVSNAVYNKLEAKLYDVTGKLLLKQLLNQSHNQLPVHRLPSGIYQLLIHNDHEKMMVKIIVIK